jgi:hypothetical protein
MMLVLPTAANISYMLIHGKPHRKIRAIYRRLNIRAVYRTLNRAVYTTLNISDCGLIDPYRRFRLHGVAPYE